MQSAHNFSLIPHFHLILTLEKIIIHEELSINFIWNRILVGTNFSTSKPNLHSQINFICSCHILNHNQYSTFRDIFYQDICFWVQDQTNLSNPANNNSRRNKDQRKLRFSKVLYLLEIRYKKYSVLKHEILNI